MCNLIFFWFWLYFTMYFVNQLLVGPKYKSPCGDWLASLLKIIIHILLVLFLARYRQSVLFQAFTHMKPVSSIFLTPSQKIKKISLDIQPPDGNWAMGNLRPPSPIKMNWSTWDASCGPLLFPESIKICTYICEA